MFHEGAVGQFDGRPSYATPAVVGQFGRDWGRRRLEALEDALRFRRLEALEDALRRLGAESGFPFDGALDDAPFPLDELLAGGSLLAFKFECSLGVSFQLLRGQVVVLGEARADQQPCS